VLGALTLLTGYMALIYELALVFLLLALLVTLAAVGIAYSIVSLRHLRAARAHPAEVLAGRPFDVTLTVTNASAARSAMFVAVEDALPDGATAEPARAVLVALGPGDQAEIPYRARFARRGDYRLEVVRVASRYPFALFERRGRLDCPSRLLVLPRPGRLTRDLLADVPQPQAEVSALARGGLGEFHAVREYRSDDNPRWIHWRTSARRGALYVREFDREIDRRLLVVLDTVSDSALFERAVTLAATIADRYAQEGLRVGLGVSGGRVAKVPFGAGRDHVRAILRVLAAVAPSREAKAPPWDPREARGAILVRVSAGNPRASWLPALAAAASRAVSIDAATTYPVEEAAGEA
jgi:uncharacterized protein (DUF58 family)